MYNKLHKINLKKMLASLVSILMLTSNINLSIFADEEPAVLEVVNEEVAGGEAVEEGGFTEEAAGGEAVEEGGFTEEAAGGEAVEEGGFTEEAAGDEVVEEGGFTEEAGNADDGANLDSSSDDSEFSSESSSKSYEDEESQG